jgi:hypothetical protein
MPEPTSFNFIIGGPVSLTGGLVVKLKAAAQLLLGDSVYLSAALTVNKSNVAATNLARVGVVVGGKGYYGETSQDILDIGDPAVAANDDVFVCYCGVAYAIADAAIVAGVKVTAGGTTTAGRVKTATVTTDVVAGDSGRIIGTALDAAGAAGDKIRVMVALD